LAAQKFAKPTVGSSKTERNGWVGFGKHFKLNQRRQKSRKRLFFLRRTSRGLGEVNKMTRKKRQIGS